MTLTTDTTTNIDADIPILLVAKESISPPNFDQPFLLVATADHSEVLSKRGNMGIDIEVAVVDTKNVDRKEAIIAALFLRNAGLTAIIGDLTKVPTDLVRDIHNFSVMVKAGGEPIRTEALVMEDAMDAYGDITDVVKYFEDNLL